MSQNKAIHGSDSVSLDKSFGQIKLVLLIILTLVISNPATADENGSLPEKMYAQPTKWQAIKNYILGSPAAGHVYSRRMIEEVEQVCVVDAEPGRVFGAVVSEYEFSGLSEPPSAAWEFILSSFIPHLMEKWKSMQCGDGQVTAAISIKDGFVSINEPESRTWRPPSAGHLQAPLRNTIESWNTTPAVEAKKLKGLIKFNVTFGSDAVCFPRIYPDFFGVFCWYDRNENFHQANSPTTSCTVHCKSTVVRDADLKTCIQRFRDGKAPE